MYLLLRKEPVIIFLGHMNGELNLGPNQGLRDTPQIGNLNSPFHLISLDVVDVLAGYDEVAFLVPPEHIDLLHLIRKKKGLCVM